MGIFFKLGVLMTIKKGFIIGFIVGFIIAGYYVWELNEEHSRACAGFWKGIYCMDRRVEYCLEWNKTNFIQPWTSWGEYAPECRPMWEGGELQHDFPSPNITLCLEMFRIVQTTTTTLPNETCEDSDGGINYYVKGFANPCPCYEPPCPTCGVWADTCLNEKILLEYSCDNLNGEAYNCPQGCQDGACL